MTTASPPPHGSTTVVPPPPSFASVAETARASKISSPPILDPKIILNDIKVKLSIPTTGTIKPKPFAYKILELTQLVDPTACLIPKGPGSEKLQPIFKTTEIPGDDRIKAYANDIQNDPQKNQINMYFTIRTQADFDRIKYQNDPMFEWLRTKKAFLTRHSMKTNNTIDLGYIHKMHPVYAHRESIKANLEDHMEDIEYTLTPRKYYLKQSDGTSIAVDMVCVIVEAARADDARMKLAQAFTDDESLTGMSFIMRPKRGLMTIAAWNSSLYAQAAYLRDIVSFAITGVSEMTTGGIAYDNPNEISTLEEILSSAHDSATKEPLLTSIEPTKNTSNEGKWLLVTTKAKIKQAMEKIDEIFDWINTHRPGAINIEGEEIRRVHRPRNNDYTKYAASIEAKFSTATPAPIPTENAWKRRNKRPPIISYDDSEFPNLSPSRKPSPTKKSRAILETDDLTQTTIAETTAVQEELNKMQSNFEEMLKQANTKHEADMAAQNRAIGNLQHLHVAQVQHSNLSSAKLDALTTMMLSLYSAQINGEQLRPLSADIVTTLQTPIPSTNDLLQQITSQTTQSSNTINKAGDSTGVVGMQQ